MVASQIEYRAGQDIGNGLRILDPTRLPVLTLAPDRKGFQPQGVTVRCWCGTPFLLPLKTLKTARGHDNRCAQKNPHPRSQARRTATAKHAAYSESRQEEIARQRRERYEANAEVIREARRKQRFTKKLDTYAPLVREAIQAFEEDFRYVEEIARAGAKLKEKQERLEALYNG
jgi:hypothetical protein